MKPRLLLLSFCVLSVFTGALSALEFRLLSWDGTIENLKYLQGQKAVGIVAWESALSPKYQYTGNGPLVLFREVERDGAIVRETVATLPPPVGLTHAILVLAANDAAGTGYSARWIDDSPETRKAQTITYENLSSYPVMIRLGDEKLSVPSLETISRPTNPTHRRLPLQIAAETDKGWELVVSQTQPIRPGLRTLVIMRDGRVQPNGLKERIDYLAFNDLPPLPTPQGSSVAGR